MDQTKDMTDASSQTEAHVDLETMAHDYLDAFQARDMARCLAFYAEDATIHFMSGVYKGHDSIQEWHQDRFAANLRVLNIARMQVSGNALVVEAVITSDRFKAWKVNSITGRITCQVTAGKIKEVKFGLAMNTPDFWRL